MMNVQGDEPQVVAVLHDMIEDTSVTADVLRQAGFGEQIVAAVLCVRHRKDKPYADYVLRCNGSEVPSGQAGRPGGQLPALADHPATQRLQGDLARIRRYVLSYKFRTNQIIELEYLTPMEESG